MLISIVFLSYSLYLSIMDALSDIIELIKLSSVVYCKWEYSSPWGINVGVSSHAQFHMLTSGSCVLKFNNNKIKLNTGDIVLFPFGDPHYIGEEDPKDSAVTGLEFLKAVKKGNPIFKNKEISTTLVCGHFVLDREFNHTFIQSLPEYIHITQDDHGSISTINEVINLLIKETSDGVLGSDIVIRRLAEILFVTIIRSYIKKKNITNGFLGALTSKDISNALKIIHKNYPQKLTLKNIADNIHISRAALAIKFKSQTGFTPIDYLYKWRMQKAYDLLKNTNASLKDISEKVGYTSFPAFNKAFKKNFNITPGRFRKELMNN